MIGKYTGQCAISALLTNRQYSPIVGATCNHAEVTKLELDKVLWLASLDVQHDGVIDLNVTQCCHELTGLTFTIATCLCA